MIPTAGQGTWLPDSLGSARLAPKYDPVLGGLVNSRSEGSRCMLVVLALW